MHRSQFDEICLFVHCLNFVHIRDENPMKSKIVQLFGELLGQPLGLLCTATVSEPSPQNRRTDSELQRTLEIKSSLAREKSGKCVQ